MNKILLLAFASMTSSLLIACTPGNNVPGATATGAIAGGLAGSQLFHGSGKTAGIVGSSLVGAVVGNQVGLAMNRNDQAQMQSNYYNSPAYYPAYSTYPTYAAPRGYYAPPPVVYAAPAPMYVYPSSSACRQYQTRVVVNNQVRTVYGTACPMPNGTWQVIN